MIKSDNRKKFTQKQLHALPFIATCQTYTLAAEKAEVTYKQICEWMLQKPFKTEVRRLQDEILEDAVASIKTATTKAADVLITLLDDEESRTRLKAANDILNHTARFKELQELEGRISALENAGEKK